jgi:hypothetical protein
VNVGVAACLKELMNISQTLVALMTSAASREEVDQEQLAEVSSLIADASRAEVVALITALANLNNFALELLEQHTPVTRSEFLMDLGQFLAENPEE